MSSGHISPGTVSCTVGTTSCKSLHSSSRVTFSDCTFLTSHSLLKSKQVGIWRRRCRMLIARNLWNENGRMGLSRLVRRFRGDLSGDVVET